MMKNWLPCGKRSPQSLDKIAHLDTSPIVTAACALTSQPYTPKGLTAGVMDARRARGECSAKRTHSDVSVTRVGTGRTGSFIAYRARLMRAPERIAQCA